MIRRLHRTCRAVGFCGGGLRRLLFTVDYCQVAKSTSTGKTVSVAERRGLSLERNLRNLRNLWIIISLHNLWIKSSIIGVNLQPVRHSFIGSAVLPALLSASADPSAVGF
jgi:hypothetical protein